METTPSRSTKSSRMRKISGSASTDLPRINEFEVKPQGACRADVCIPLSKNLQSGAWFNLTGFARKVNETVVADPAPAPGASAKFPWCAADSTTPASPPISRCPTAKAAWSISPIFAAKKFWSSPGRPGEVAASICQAGRKSTRNCKDQNFEIVAAAQDTGGEAAAGQWYDSRQGDFHHADRRRSTASARPISSSTCRWASGSMKRGRVVRPAEPAWTTDSES